MSQITINPDLANERKNATIDVEEMKKFLGELIYFNSENHQRMIDTSKINSNKIP